ncbi:MAG: hypothetical protein WDM85_09485 [Caulobacteraceae bacterium]
MRDDLAGDATCPASPTPGERLLLDGLRCWASSRMDGKRPDLAVRRLIGWRTSERVGALFVAWMQAVEAGRRRPIRTHCAHCRGASIDEQRLILSLGVASIDMQLGETLLAPLLAEPAGVMALARALNAALAASSLPVPARLCGAPVRHESTLH